MASRIPALRGWLVVLVLGAALGLAAVALTGGGGAGKPPPSATTGPATRATPARMPELAVLHRWDLARSRAWAHDDRTGLAALYVAGSGAGRADAALLASYRRRGLVVTGMRRQVLAVRVLASAPRRLTLRVTDRLVGATAHASGAARALPSSQPRTRTLVLRRAGDGAWRMAAVRW